MLSKGQRCIIGMLDGFGISYLEATELPVIKNKLIKKGLFKKCQVLSKCHQCK